MLVAHEDTAHEADAAGGASEDGAVVLDLLPEFFDEDRLWTTALVDLWRWLRSTTGPGREAWYSLNELAWEFNEANYGAGLFSVR